MENPLSSSRLSSINIGLRESRDAVERARLACGSPPEFLTCDIFKIQDRLRQSICRSPENFAEEFEDFPGDQEEEDEEEDDEEEEDSEGDDEDNTKKNVVAVTSSQSHGAKRRKTEQARSNNTGQAGLCFLERLPEDLQGCISQFFSGLRDFWTVGVTSKALRKAFHNRVLLSRVPQ